MHPAQSATKVFLFMLLVLATAALACSPLPGGSAPTAAPTAAATTAATAEVQASAEPQEASPTPEARPTARPKATLGPKATAASAIALKSYTSKTQLFGIKYPSAWKKGSESELGVQFTGESADWVLAVSAIDKGEQSDKDALERAASSFLGALEQEANYELLDHQVTDTSSRYEFKVTNKETGTLVHASVHLEAAGRYVFVVVMSVEDAGWSEWQSSAKSILDSLQIDQDLAAQTASPTAEPGTGGDLTIVNQVAYKDLYDNWRITGEVRNDGKQAISYGQLSVELFDIGEKSLKQDTLYLSRDIVPPGELSPFMYYVDSDLTTFHHFRLGVADLSTTDDKLVELELSNDSIYIDGDGNAYVLGELTNKTGKNVEIKEISASVYSGAGKSFEAGDSSWTYLHYLKPDATGPFMIELRGPLTGADSYKVFVDAVTTTDPAPKVSIENEILYKDEYDQWHMAGEVVNNSAKSLHIALVVAVYDGDGKLVDVNSDSSFFSTLGGIPADGTDGFDIKYFSRADNANLSDARYLVQVDSYLTYETDTVLEQGLDITNEDQSQNGDTFTFTGDLENTNSFDLEDAMVTVVVKDKKTGQVQGAGYNWLSDAITAGGKVSYEVKIYLLPGTNVDDVEYDVVAYGTKQQ